MKDAINAAAVIAALAASVALAAGSARSFGRAHGAAVPPAGARRIVSATTVADRLLLDLCEADRVVAVSGQSLHGPDAHRYRGREIVQRIDDVEQILALRPDVVIVQNVADPRRVERLRDAGLSVLDLGPLRGARSLREDAARVAALCGAPERAAPYAARWERRLRSIARHLPASRRRGGIYLAVYAGRTFGGTRGSSYHDVLVHAGLRDQAAARYSGWPEYSTEQLLSLDPEVIVTRAGMTRELCERPSLARLGACRRGDVIEIDGALLDAPGPGILEAAEAVHAAVYERGAD